MYEWFLVTMGDKQKMYFLVYAVTKDEAIEKVAGRGEVGDIKRVTWLTMERITGCTIPGDVKPEDFATGCLSFHNCGYCVSVWP